MWSTVERMERPRTCFADPVFSCACCPAQSPGTITGPGPHLCFDLEGKGPRGVLCGARDLGWPEAAGRGTAIVLPETVRCAPGDAPPSEPPDVRVAGFLWGFRGFVMRGSQGL